MYWDLEDKSKSIWESRTHFPPFHYKCANVSATIWADSAPYEGPRPGFLLVTPLVKPQKPSRNSHRLLYERHRLIHLLKMVSGIFSTTFALGMDKKSACSSLRSRSPNTGHKKLKAGAFSKSNHKYVTKHSVASYCHSYFKRLLLFLELYCWMICTVQKQPFNALVQILLGLANCLWLRPEWRARQTSACCAISNWICAKSKRAGHFQNKTPMRNAVAFHRIYFLHSCYLHVLLASKYPGFWVVVHTKSGHRFIILFIWLLFCLMKCTVIQCKW